MSGGLGGSKDGEKAESPGLRTAPGTPWGAETNEQLLQKQKFPFLKTFDTSCHITF